MGLLRFARNDSPGEFFSNLLKGFCSPFLLVHRKKDKTAANEKDD
jgi:hypothetical protein